MGILSKGDISAKVGNHPLSRALSILNNGRGQNIERDAQPDCLFRHQTV